MVVGWEWADFWCCHGRSVVPGLPLLCWQLTVGVGHCTRVHASDHSVLSFLVVPGPEPWGSRAGDREGLSPRQMLCAWQSPLLQALGLRRAGASLLLCH